MARPTVDPMSLEFNQIPLRRESSRYVRLGEAPSDAQLTATVLLKGDVPPSLVRVKHVTASRLMPIPMEDYDRPPHAPPYPHVELTGVIVGQSDGTTPLGIE